MLCGLDYGNGECGVRLCAVAKCGKVDKKTKMEDMLIKRVTHLGCAEVLAGSIFLKG